LKEGFFREDNDKDGDSGDSGCDSEEEEDFVVAKDEDDMVFSDEDDFEKPLRKMMTTSKQVKKTQKKASVPKEDAKSDDFQKRKGDVMSPKEANSTTQKKAVQLKERAPSKKRKSPKQLSDIELSTAKPASNDTSKSNSVKPKESDIACDNLNFNSTPSEDESAERRRGSREQSEIKVELNDDKENREAKKKGRRQSR